MWAVSDDRGKFGAPRIYKFILKKELSLELVDVVFVKDKDKKLPVYDLESISMLPWGNFLVNSEGDDRARPARLPRLIEVKTNGDYVRDFPLPEVYLPGKVGSAPQGLRTNFGFEAMGASLDGKSWILGSESWLAQDTENISRLQKYQMKEAWVLQPTESAFYYLNFERGFLNGLTEILNWKDDRWLFLERTVDLEGNEITTPGQILEARISGQDPVRGHQVLDFKKLKAKNVAFKGNYEAMVLGPDHAQGRILIVANDNNFEKKAATQFLFFAVKDEPTR